MQHAIIAEGLSVTREGKPVLQEVTFTIPVGSITGLIGPSGSGKTTLMRTIVGVQELTAGTLRVLDRPAGYPELRQQIGYVTQAPAVYMDLTVRENLAYFAVIVGASAKQVLEVLEQVDLQDHADQIVNSLSGGQQARVSLAIALLGNAQLLVLDEPTVGLDPVLRRRLWDLFAELAESGRTLLVSSHVMDEAEQCPGLLLLRDGKVLHAGSRAALLEQTGAEQVEDAFIKLVEGAPHAS